MSPSARTDEPQDLERQPTVFLVATSHLDTQWRWTVERTIREFLPRTVAGNLALFERFPSYVLSFEGAFRYMLIQEYYPELWRRLVDACAAGLWQPAGSMLDSPDVNIPSPESLIRHVLYGNSFFARELGRPSKDIFLPDCFGFGFALPSIAAHCGLVGFSSQKFIKWMPPAKIPFDLGLWKGPDGKAILAVLNPDGYGDPIREDLTASPRLEGRIERLRRASGLPATYMYFGTGDQGGPLDAGSMERLEAALAGRGEGPIRVVHGASDQLFELVTPEQAERLPTYSGELLLPRHGTGGLTSVSFLKRANRKNEQRALAAESAATIASLLGARLYPHEQLRSAWIRFLWHQQHDGITGTSIPRANRIAANDHAVAANLFADVQNTAAAAVARGLARAPIGIASLLVFNPLGVARQDVVTVSIAFEEEAPPALSIFDAAGVEVPCQILSRGERRLEVAFLAHLPALTFAPFEVRPATASRVDEELQGDEHAIENHRYRIVIDEAGNPASIEDKLLGRELLSGAQRLELLPDRPRRWPAWEVRFRDLAAEPLAVSDQPARVRLIERGPVRIVLEIERTLSRSRLLHWLRLGARGAGERIEIETLLDWRDRGALLKASFPLTAGNRAATFDLGLGVIERDTATPTCYEVPAQQWADLSHADGSFGVSILSDARCGWNKPDEHTLRLSLVRSPRAQWRYRHHATQDLGRHRLRYGVYGHAGPWSDSDVVAQAARFNQPMLCWQTEGGDGRLPHPPSLVHLSDEQAVIETVKRPEKELEGEHQIVVRMRETRGRNLARLEMSFASQARRAQSVDGSENRLAGAEILGGTLVTSLEPFAIKSHLIELAPLEKQLGTFQSEPIVLPLDLCAHSFHGESGRRFDRKGRSFPAELLRPELVSGGVRFRLGSLRSGGASALRCHGQRVALPSGPWRSLHLLACSIREDRGDRGEFVIGPKSRSLDIGSWSGWLPVGPAELAAESDWAPPRPAPIGWLGTHCHDRKGSDIPYRFCYLFRYDLALPGGARDVVLANNRAIRLFALSVSDRALL